MLLRKTKNTMNRLLGSDLFLACICQAATIQEFAAVLEYFGIYPNQRDLERLLAYVKIKTAQDKGHE